MGLRKSSMIIAALVLSTPFMNCSKFEATSESSVDSIATRLPGPVATPGPSGSPAPTGTPGASALPNFQITRVGNRETVFHHATDACADDDIPDTLAHAFRDASGKVNLTISHHVDNYRSTGPTLDSLTHVCAPTLVSANDTVYTDATYFEWIASPYTLDGTKVVSLVHNEWYPVLRTPSCTGGWANSITLAVSTDSGATYKHPANYKIRVPGIDWNPSFDCDANSATQTIYGSFLPSGIIDGRDGFYYSYFREIAGPTQLGGDRTCLLRTPQLDSAAAWTVWTGADWQAALSTINCAKIDFSPLDWPGWLSVKYSTYFQKYIGLLDAGDDNGGPRLYYALSDDLIHWSTAIPFANDIESYAGGVPQYWALLDPTDTSRNFDNVGQDPYIYFTVFLDNNLNRDLVRQQIHFEKTAASPSTNYNFFGP